MTLSDLAASRLVVACERCGRTGSYSVVKLYAERGDLRLTDFLSELTSTGPNARSIGWHERKERRWELESGRGGNCASRTADEGSFGSDSADRS
jgi:hypothetical protein